MPDMVDKAKMAIADLLKRLGIERVYCVDDIYPQEWTIDDLLVVQRELSPGQLLDLLPQIGTVPDDPDVRREKFRSAWGRLDSTAQTELGDKMMASAQPSPSGTENDAKAASMLRDLVGKDRLTELAPANWDENEGQVLELAGTSGVLVLFDKDLSKAGGSATGGMALLKNVLGKDASGKLICGLLTHTATTETQQAQWEQCANENDVDKDRFVLVAKQWLNDDPQGFVRMLKLVALAPDCRRMKAKGKAILESVTKETAHGTEKLSVFDFDHIVFRQSHSEGIWEADMLFRLHDIFHRPALRLMAYGDSELKEIIGRLRAVSEIPADPEGTGAPEQTSWDLQQREMYETGEHINSLHLPIEVGDIFEKTNGPSTKAFILLGQPCDLMVRSRGERQPEICDVLLTEIVPRSADEKERPEYADILEYYGGDPKAVYYVKFRRTHFVDPCVLDLCVFQADGVSRMDVASVCPEGLLPGWTKRFELLKKQAEATLLRYRELGRNKSKEAATQDMRRAVALFPPTVGNSRIFKATVEFDDACGRLLFNCRRVKRLCRPRALALTLQYVTCFTRPAFDRDLGLPLRDD